MVRTNQGGSVLSFIVIGAILACLLIGGVFVVHHQVLRSQTGHQENKPLARHPQTPDKTPVKTDDKMPDETQQQPSAQHEAAELPQTGSVGTMSVVLVLGLLSGMGVAYLRSRRQAHYLL
jgi:LPXTG-motif cell wall-anchored protein